jgi:pSer/pThr/pTyr-binding forkhead associated (FHA) protein
VSEQLLNVLKLCLLALLYLFFFRVLSAVWAELRAPKAAEATASRAPAARREGKPVSARKAAKATPTQLRVLEPDAQKGRSFALSDEVTVGRAAGCQVTVDDTYVSQLHARVFSRDGKLYVEDLGSTNGTYLNRKKVSGPIAMQRGDRLQVGNTVMELA